MDDRQLALLLTALSDQTAATNRMADAMTGILLHLDPKQAAKFAAPGYKRPLSAYANFDWNSISANVISRDKWGATEVEYNGASFRRYRSNDDDPKGTDIRFRRVVSGTPEGKDMVWASLIKFFDPKPKDPPRPLRGELAERITDAQQNGKPIAIAVAPVKAISAPAPAVAEVAKTEAQTAAQQWLDAIKQKGHGITVADARKANARGVALALASNLPADFIDAHTSPNDENSGPAMISHAVVLLTAIVTGNVPEAA